MPLEARFLHWLQAADEELLSSTGAPLVPAEEASPEETMAGEGLYDRWEARARAAAAENAAAREDDAWTSL